MNLDDYLKKVQNLRTGVNHGHIKPHKPVMLLTILSLIENRKITSNRIDYSPQLLELFKKFFDIVRSEQDALNPLLPFFYLRGDGFFHHRPFKDQGQSYNALSDPGSIKKFTGIVEYAYLDDRIEGCKEIINLDKRKILLPQDKKYTPKTDSLTWRHTRILR